MMPDALAEMILRAVRERVPRFTGEIDLDTRIGADGLGLDSVSCLELLLEIERETGLVLRENALSDDTFATPRGLLRDLLQS